jgi:hypothetical protein
LGEIVANKLSKAHRNVLVQLESILGNECYNASIQNYGPGGVREADGRGFRYPLMIRLGNQEKQKIRDYRVPSTISDEALRSGYYAFGANQLDVMAALEKMLRHLEENHGLIIKKDG